MPGICPKCGLPKDICVCEALEKEQPHRISIYVDKKRFGKVVTIIEGLDEKEIGKIAKELKHKIATGGTYKEGIVMLQGDHKHNVKEALIKMGFREEDIFLR
ncbi:MAG: stress response translation initiation inhibitor YciH [Candidatus Micrarchaeia archaeon]